MAEDKINRWSKTHVFYNMYEHEPSNDAPLEIKREHEWRIKMLKDTPNGNLIINNSFFNDLRKNNKMSFLHTTSNLSKIIESGSLYSSGGCLVGGIYTTPLFQEKEKFRLHNLGRYILDKEIKKASYLQNKGEKSNNLIIEVDLPSNNHGNLIGVNYIKMGNIHLDIYKELEYLLSFEERIRLQEVLINKIKNSIAYLSLANNSYINNKKPDPKLFFDLFLSTVDHLPILGYLYFEIVSEYLMLFEDSDIAKRAHELGELHNHTYKDMMFEIFPRLLRGHSLSIFKPTIEQIANYIRQKKIISEFNQKEMIDYLMNRLIFLTNTCLFNLGSSLIEWRNIQWTFENLSLVATPLLGHLIHREFRNFGRYPDFYFYFDQYKALQVWNYWNQMDIAIPFNGFIPKGETGINPACPYLKYKIYLGKITRKNNSENSYIEPEKELNIKIVPRLVNIKYSTMRSKDKNSLENLSSEKDN